MDASLVLYLLCVKSTFGPTRPLTSTWRKTIISFSLK